MTFPILSLVQSMDEAVKKLIGEHDYRNLCKMDVANGVTNFTRKILSAEIITTDEKLVYSNPCLKRPLSKRQKIGFRDQLSLNAGQK